MAYIEVDENELAELKQVQATVRQMLANPSARKRVLQAQKDVNPNLVIPELDAAKPILDEVGSLRSEMAEFIKSQKDAEMARQEEARMDKLRTRWEAGRRSAREEGYTEEGLNSLEAFMEKNGIADHSLAIPAFERLNPPAQPAISGAPDRFDIFQPDSRADENLKLLFDGAEDQFLARVIPAALAEANPSRSTRR